MKIKKLIGQNAYWQVNKELAQKIGIEPALLLSEIIDCYDYFKERNELVKYDGVLYYFQTSEKIEEKTSLSYRKQKSCIKVLLDNGFIKTTVKGIPAKLHFHACEDNILNFFGLSINDNVNTTFSEVSNTVLAKRENLDCHNANSIYKENNNKELNNKNNNKNEYSHTQENSEKAFGKGKEQEAVLKAEVVESIEVVDSEIPSPVVEIVENIEVLEPDFEVETVEVEEVTTNLFGEVVNTKGVRMIEGVVGKKKIKLEDNWVNRLIVENELTEILKMKVPLTNKKLEKIELSYSKESITKKILAMGNSRDLSKRNLDAGLTLSNWLSYENDRNKTKQGTEFKPSAPTVLWAEQMGVEATPEFEKTVDKFVYFGDHSFEALKERKRAMHEGSDIADRI